jgi:hypothetical protein
MTTDEPDAMSDPLPGLERLAALFSAIPETAEGEAEELAAAEVDVERLAARIRAIVATAREGEFPEGGS